MGPLIAITMLVLFVAANTTACDFLKQADKLYQSRARGFDNELLLADSVLADSCITLYLLAVDESEGPVREEASWKLLRAYFFRGFYATPDSDRKKRLYDDAIDVGKRAVEEFPESPGINVWMATMWGLWAESHGSMSAATRGVAGKIRKHCETALLSDSTFCDAGALRVLAGVYFKAPKIPLILGWPSKKKALEFINRSLAIAPDNLFSQRCQAEILYARKKHEQACEIMFRIASGQETVSGLVEDTQIRQRASEILTEWIDNDDDLRTFADENGYYPPASRTGQPHAASAAYPPTRPGASQTPQLPGQSLVVPSEARPRGIR